MSKHLFLIFTACLVLLSACSVPQQSTPTSAQPIPTDSLNHTPTSRPASETPQPTATLTLTATVYLSATPADSPTPLPNLRHTPMTLMLHKPSVTFDSLTFLEGFVEILQEEELQVVTYRDLSKAPDLSAVEQGRLCIITIDDIYLRYPIAEGVLQMIDLLKEAGYPAVLGVITESDYVYPETIATLKELSALGWEIASHTDSHRNLQEVMNISPKAIYPEVKTSLDKIEDALGLRPITLVLPFGQMTATDEQIKRTGVQWVVGINGGITYEMDAAYYYVGRESPDDTPQETFENMQARFGG